MHLFIIHLFKYAERLEIGVEDFVLENVGRIRFRPFFLSIA